MKNLISFKYILIVFILFAGYALSPVEMATKVDLLDSKKRLFNLRNLYGNRDRL